MNAKTTDLSTANQENTQTTHINTYTTRQAISYGTVVCRPVVRERQRNKQP
jgi:hypothetical protein